MSVAALHAGTWLLTWGLAGGAPLASGTGPDEQAARRPLEGPLLGIHAVHELSAREPHMILVRRSTFRMGSTSEEILSAFVQCAAEPRGHQCEDSFFADEAPEHTVTLDAYWLDAFEVTVAEYDACVVARRCSPLPFSSGGARFADPLLPASLVTWHEAAAFCAWRGARLPTEAEFERAARGPRGRRYPWGDRFHSGAANHGQLGWDPADPSDGARELAAVGSYASGRTPDGFHDLAGNVAEWTLDRYAERYPAGEASNPTGPSSTAGSPLRVVRGGSYESAAPWLRGAARDAALPSVRRPTIGFRCARSSGVTPDGADEPAPAP